MSIERPCSGGWPATNCARFERQIAAIDAELRALCRAYVELKARLDILISISISISIQPSANWRDN